MCAERGKRCRVFGTDGIFNEEGMVLFDSVAQLNSVGWRQACMHLEDDFDFIADSLPHVFHVLNTTQRRFLLIKAAIAPNR